MSLITKKVNAVVKEHGLNSSQTIEILSKMAKNLKEENQRASNHNKLVFGKSGSGMSFYMETAIKHLFEQGNIVLVLDPKGELHR